MENKTLTASGIIDRAKRAGSLKETVLEHADTYGVNQINELLPADKNLTPTPKFLNNKVEWVNKILSSVHTQPFTRVKTIIADVTPETLRAKGYIKGTRKEEDVLTLLKRTTSPTTIYKKQKLDRDDIIDITDFNVVDWIKTEMRMKLDQELAQAILIGDGRLESDRFKIDETCIRPIYNDDDLYCIKKTISKDGGKYKEFINACVRIRKEYRGSGTPILFTTEDLIAELLLIEDANGRRIYTSLEEVKTILRVSDIVPVNQMNNLIRTTDDGAKKKVMGIIVNLSDYSLGADKGGTPALFDDFDIDYNQYKYLIETRRSGALTEPYSAMVIEEDYVETKLAEGETDADEDGLDEDHDLTEE